MSKEYVWKLPVGGAEKEITCEASGNKYFLYVGDAFVDTYYKNTAGDVDVEVTLCGVPCRFVSLGDKPDLVVDGVMLSSGKDYAAEKAKHTKANKGFALAEIVVGVFALASLVLYAILKGNLTALLPVFVVPAGFIALGVYELLSAYKKSKKNTETEETDKEAEEKTEE